MAQGKNLSLRSYASWEAVSGGENRETKMVDIAKPANRPPLHKLNRPNGYNLLGRDTRSKSRFTSAALQWLADFQRFPLQSLLQNPAQDHETGLKQCHGAYVLDRRYRQSPTSPKESTGDDKT
jgi:hypothetical protein